MLQLSAHMMQAARYVDGCLLSMTSVLKVSQHTLRQTAAKQADSNRHRCEHLCLACELDAHSRRRLRTPQRSLCLRDAPEGLLRQRCL